MPPSVGASKAVLAPWQPPVKGEGKPFSLSGLKASAKPYSNGDKADGKDAVEDLAVEIDALQNLFYADRRYKLLVILQGTDTSG
jgi:polyphosphate kinase 2 (PPK2 family)